MKIEKPEPGEYTAYTINYIKLLPDDAEVLRHLSENLQTTTDFILSLAPEKLDYVYAPGKWTIREMWLHVADSERVFAYRALCFARGEMQNLPGFEENDFAANSNAKTRDIRSILEEFAAVRRATLALFQSFDASVLTKIGTANNNPTSVRALAYQIAGHELHHLNVIKERYL